MRSIRATSGGYESRGLAMEEVYMKLLGEDGRERRVPKIRYDNTCTVRMRGMLVFVVL